MYSRAPIKSPLGIERSSQKKLRVAKERNRNKKGAKIRLPRGLASERGRPQHSKIGQETRVKKSWSSIKRKKVSGVS